MNNCNHCGEYKECRDMVVYGDLVGRFTATEPICKKCSIALKITNRKLNKEAQEKKEKKQQEWIKERDKILNETNNGKT